MIRIRNIAGGAARTGAAARPARHVPRYRALGGAARNPIPGLAPAFRRRRRTYEEAGSARAGDQRGGRALWAIGRRGARDRGESGRVTLYPLGSRRSWRRLPGRASGRGGGSQPADAAAAVPRAGLKALLAGLCRDESPVSNFASAVGRRAGYGAIDDAAQPPRRFAWTALIVGEGDPHRQFGPRAAVFGAEIEGADVRTTSATRRLRWIRLLGASSEPRTKSARRNVGAAGGRRWTMGVARSRTAYVRPPGPTVRGYAQPEDARRLRRQCQPRAEDAARHLVGYAETLREQGAEIDDATRERFTRSS